MHSTKTENAELENLLSEYFRARSYGGAAKNNKSSTYVQNYVHKKYNKPDTPIFEFKTFSSMTSLHGYYHFVENNFSKIGKYFWAICLIFIYTLCGMSIYMLTYMFWKMPAIISLDNSASSIWNIPFPAVTICSANKARPSIYNHNYSNNTDIDDQLIQKTMHSVCEKNPAKLKHSEEFLNGPFVSQVLKNLSFPCEEVVKVFRWLDFEENDPCSIWFQETFTSHGLCYSFNMMPMRDLLNGVDEWSLENKYSWKSYKSSWQPDTGYSQDAVLSHLPMRTYGNSDDHSVTMKLDLHTEDFNKECAQGLDVFYVLIHNPSEWPDRSHPTLLVSTNTLMTMSVKPVVFTTSKVLIPWSPHIRQCYFQNEKKLKFFKFYTQKNCILECRSNNILEKCGCVPFYHLRITSTPVCGPAKALCWIAASQFSLSTCHCLPGCSELYYKISVMNAPFNRTQKSDSSITMTGSVLLSIYFHSKNYIGLNRIMTFTFGEFLGNVGGIMGLCLGFSFLSLAEVIYFLTLRPIVNYWNLKRKKKRVDPALQVFKINRFETHTTRNYSTNRV